MADHEVEEEEPQAGQKRKGKEETELERQGDKELLIDLYDCLWNIAHEDCIYE